MKTNLIISTSLVTALLAMASPSQGAKNLIQQPLILCQQKTYLLELNHALETNNQTEVKTLYDNKKCLTFPARQGLQYTVSDMPDENGIVTLDIFLKDAKDTAFTYESWLKNSSILDSQ